MNEGMDGWIRAWLECFASRVDEEWRGGEGHVWVSE